MTNGRVASRSIRFKQKLGSWRGLRFTYGKNTVGCTRKVLEQDVYTAPYGFGADLPLTHQDGRYTGGYRKILTKRPERFAECLSPDWGDGWDNVMLNVTCENQRRADERIPILLRTSAKHKGIMCAPFIGPVSVGRYFGAPSHGAGLEQVICGGENYEDSRPRDFSWVQALSAECRECDVTFSFIETGSNFVVDGRTYRIPKRLQAEQAYKSGVGYEGKPIEWRLTDPLGPPLTDGDLYVPRFRKKCRCCSGRLICNGCGNCGGCGEPAELLRAWEELIAETSGA